MSKTRGRARTLPSELSLSTASPQMPCLRRFISYLARKSFDRRSIALLRWSSSRQMSAIGGRSRGKSLCERRTYRQSSWLLGCRSALILRVTSVAYTRTPRCERAMSAAKNPPYISIDENQVMCVARRYSRQDYMQI